MTRGRLALAVLLLAVAAAVAYGWQRVARLTGAPLPLAAPTTVLIAPGSSVRGIARALAADGVIADPEDLVWAVRLWGAAPLKASH